MNETICEGSLKQQCQDETGLYEWIRKDFKLTIVDGLLDIKHSGTDTAVSIYGAKYAKEWSYSSALSGYGFDLVWTSGKIWSFLVDDEDTCKHWVTCLNESISVINSNPNEAACDLSVVVTDNHNKEKINPRKQPFHLSDSIDDLQASRAVEKPPLYDHNMHTPNNYVNPSTAVPRSADATHMETYTPSDMQHQNMQRTINRHGARGQDHQRQTNTIYHEHNLSDSAALRLQQNKSVGPSEPPSHHNATYTSTTASSSSAPPPPGAVNLSEIPAVHSGPGSVASLDQSPTISSSGSEQQQHNDRRGEHIRPADGHTLNREHTASDYSGVSETKQSDAHYGSEFAHQRLKHRLFSGDSTMFGSDHRMFPSALSPPAATGRSEVHAGSASAVADSSSDGASVRESASAVENELHNNLLRERSRCQQLERDLERRQLEADLAQTQLDGLQKESLQRVAELQRQVDQMKERERRAEMDMKVEVESRVVRASNENNSFYEASAKAAKVQHARELACIREELVAERKRHSALMEKEVNLRNMAEMQEQSLRGEFAALQDKLNILLAEHSRTVETHRSEAASWEKKRSTLVQEHTARVAQLEREKNDAVTRAQKEVHAKTQELNAKYQESLKNITHSDGETLRQEYEGEMLRRGAEMQRRCQHEVELVRTEERRVAAVELANLRAAYVKREHATAEDLLQLEKLHNSRVGQLEQQVANLKTTNERLSEELHAASVRADKGSESVQQKALQFRKQMEEHCARAEQLHNQLASTQDELQQAQGREASYRTQLARALEDTKVKSAELIEARQQAASGSMQAQQWQKVSRETELSIAASETALQIARDEVAMLEFELRRVRDENAALKQEMYRADKLIFGVAQHQPETRRAVKAGVENAVPRNASYPDYPVAQQHSKIIYSTPSNVKGTAKTTSKLTHSVGKTTTLKTRSPGPASPSPYAYRTVVPASPSTSRSIISAGGGARRTPVQATTPQPSSFGKSSRML